MALHEMAKLPNTDYKYWVWIGHTEIRARWLAAGYTKKYDNNLLVHISKQMNSKKGMSLEEIIKYLGK